MNSSELQNELRRLIDPVNVFIADFLPDQPPREIYGVIREFVSRGGKRLRASLCLTAAEIAGGRAGSAVPAAAAIELFHAFTLMHDDIMDDSELRRGRPCVHITEGAAIATNAGDALFLQAIKCLVRLPSDKIALIETLLFDRLQKVFEGQAEELAWVKDDRWDITEADYRQMVEKKTAALIAAALEVGAVIGGGDQKVAATLAEYGRLIGVGFQVQDDRLNLIGDERKYQKEIGGDITEGKRSLITIHALRNLDPARRDSLRQILSAHTRDQAKIKEAIELVRFAGSLDYAAGQAVEYIRKAQEQLVTIPPSKAASKVSATLAAIADFVIQREG